MVAVWRHAGELRPGARRGLDLDLRDRPQPAHRRRSAAPRRRGARPAGSAVPARPGARRLPACSMPPSARRGCATALAGARAGAAAGARGRLLRRAEPRRDRRPRGPAARHRQVAHPARVPPPAMRYWATNWRRGSAMTDAAPMVEIWRGDVRRVASPRPRGGLRRRRRIVAAWGDPDAVDPAALVVQDAAGAAAGGERRRPTGLTPERLALACASHSGAAMHVEPGGALARRPGARPRRTCAAGRRCRTTRRSAHRLRAAGEAPCQLHNNCSGKHAGFLTLNRRLGGGPRVRRDRPSGAAGGARRLRGDVRRRRAPAGGSTAARRRTSPPPCAGLALAMARMADPRGLGPAREARPGGSSRRWSPIRCSSPARAGPAPS